MKQKSYIGKLISIKFTDRELPVYGYVIDYNDDWTLMKHNTGDYQIDGYIAFRNKNIEGFRRSDEEKWREKIINLKGLKPTAAETIPITNLETILQYLTQHFGIFQLETKVATKCYLGSLHSINSKALVIHNFNTKAKWDGQLSFRPGDVRFIEFDNDYIRSLQLVAKKKRATIRP